MITITPYARSTGRLACVTFALVVLPACATWTAPTDTGDAPLRARAVTDTKQDVRISATVLSTEDSVRMLGADVNATGVQPVWIEVRNDTENVLWLLRSGVDPDYFSPLEVAWSSHVTLARETNARIDEHFKQLAFPNPILAHDTSSGILFTNPQPVTKLLTIDLLGSKMMIPFTLLLPVPGEIAAGKQVLDQYAGTEITNYEDLDSLRKAISGLPCCAVTAGGSPDGEPLNVVLVGRLEDLAAAVNRRGYRRDQSAPDASQQLFGRPADLSFRKRAQAGSSASWLRMWRAPLHYRGQTVFMSQAGRPVGGRFLDEKTSQILRLHADVDEVRNDLIHDFMYSGGLERLAFVSGVGEVSADRPRALPDGSHYYTDGRRVVLFLGTRPRTFADVEVLQWEPILPERSAGSEKDESGAGH